MRDMITMIKPGLVLKLKLRIDTPH